MMKDIALCFKIAAVFIGTVVGAGLASGQEIIQFFTVYGLRGIFGIIFCGILYIIIGIITIDLSYKYKASSYNDLIYLSCGRYLGYIIDMLTTLFLFGGTCIILAGSGSIFVEYLNLSRILGIIAMATAVMIVVFFSTDGLIFINSIIVPCMITVIFIISIMVFTGKTSAIFSIKYDIINAPTYKSNWFFSSLLYISFNMLTATGVLSPMTRDIKRSKGVFGGIVIGSIILLVLTLLIDIIIMINQPKVFQYSIPMLYIAKSAGHFMEGILSIIIWMEMFSTAVSDIYSLAKKINHSLNMNYNLSVILLLLFAVPFTSVGFENLIKILYPPFGFISLIYIICLIILYYKSKKLSNV